MGDNPDTIEARQNKAYGVFSGDQENLATHIDESMYSYPIVDPDICIEAKRNEAANIVTKKNEAYKPVSTASVSGSMDEYDYILENVL